MLPTYTEQMSLAAGFDYFQVGRKHSLGVSSQGFLNFIKASLQLITWREVHRLTHFRSGVEA